MTDHHASSSGLGHDAGSIEQPNTTVRTDDDIPSPEAQVETLAKEDCNVANLSNVEGIVTLSSVTDPADRMTSSQGFALVCDCVEKLRKIGDIAAEVHPWASIAWSILNVIPKALIAQMDHDLRVQDLWAIAADMLAFLKDPKPVVDEVLAPIVSDMMKQICEVAMFVSEYGAKKFLVQDMLNSSSDPAISKYRSAFQQLKERFTSRSTLVARQGVVRLSGTLEDVKDMGERQILDDMEGNLESVRCDTDAICLPATRRLLLQEIMKWIADSRPDCPRVFWLHGVAGSGKSTIANTIASYYMELELLGASFHFDRDVDGRNGPTLLFRKIASQLAHFNGQFRDKLFGAITEGKMDTYPLREQLKKFIIEPMNEISLYRPVVIVIDALDECGTADGRAGLLAAMADELPKLPSFVKILVTSRDEPDICARLTTTSLSKSINDVQDIADDILAYIENRMDSIINMHPRLGQNWPGPEMKEKLCSRADGLFVWIAVVSRHINESSDPERALNDVVYGQTADAGTRRPEAILDELYLGILQRSSTLSDSPRATKYVVGSIMVAKTPLTRTGLDSLLGLSKDTLENPINLRDGSQITLTSSASYLGALGPVLRTDDTGIRVLHPSIKDFFIDPHRCTDDRFFVDKSKFHSELAIRCFNVMGSLKRDICAIDDPTKLNWKISDLDDRIEKHLPEHLLYACRFWYRHLVDGVDDDAETYRQAKDFLSTHLLHWIEVMSLLDDIDSTFRALDVTKSWFQKQICSESDVNQLLDDALRFVRQFHEPIRQVAAHVYVSIPFTPPSSMVFKIYAHTLRDIPKLISGTATPAALISLPLWWRGNALSVDHSRFIIAHDRNTMQIWDVATCNPIGEPLIGHTAPVRIISFSNDGTKFCSVDERNCILVWDAETYKTSGAPLQPSIASGFIVQIGLVGDRVVGFVSEQLDYDLANSLIFNRTDRVCLWDIATGELVASYKLDADFGVYLEGAYLVWTMEEYPNKVTRILDVLTAEDVMNKYTHDQTILWVDVSPDNTRLACGYDDDAIRILDVRSGDIIGDPIKFDGRCASFASQGRRFVIVGSQAIAIYDIDTGKLVGGPVEGEFGPAFGVDLVSDPSRLVLRMDVVPGGLKVVDVRSAKVIVDFRKTYFTNCALSPDGAHIICWRDAEVTIFDLALAAYHHPEGDNIASITPSPTSQQFLLTFSDNTLRLSGPKVDVSSAIVLNGAASPAAFSPDASTIVSAFMDHTLQLWNSKGASPMEKPLQGHDSPITAVAFSPSGSRLISASRDNVILVWDVASGVSNFIRPQTYSSVIYSISLSPDESRVICASENGFIQVLDASNGIAISHSSNYNCWRWAEFSPDGSQITCLSTDGRRRSVDGRTGQILADITPPYARTIKEVAFSPDGTHFISISTVDTVAFSDVTAFRTNGSNRYSGAIKSLTFSFDGRWMISVLHDEDKTVVHFDLWDSQTGRLIWKIMEPGLAYHTLAGISHSGNRIFTYQQNRFGDSYFRVRNTSLRTIIFERETKGLPKSVAFSADEKQFTCVFWGGTVETWDIESGIMLDSKDASIDTDWNPATSEGITAISPDQSRLAVAHQDWTLTLSHITDGTDEVVFDMRDSSIRSLVFSPDGSRFASVVADTVIRVWDTSTGAVLRESLQHAQRIVSFVFSPDGTRIISLSYDPSRDYLGVENKEMIAQMWNVSEGSSVVLTSPNEDVRSVVFIPDGVRFITMSWTGIMQTWDMAQSVPSLLSTFATSGFFDTMLISANGCRLLAWGDKRFLLFDLVKQKRLIDTSETPCVRTAIFSSDGSLAAYSDGFSVEVVDAATGTGLLRLLHLHHDYTHNPLSFSPDCSKLFFLSENGNILIFDIDSEHLSTSVDVRSSYPQDRMTLQPSGMDMSGGWYLGENMARLIWLPAHMRQVWLATGKQPGSRRRLILGLNSGDSKVAVLDMEDYLEVVSAANTWRDGGVRYVKNKAEIAGAYALMAESGPVQVGFGAACLEL